MMMTEAEIRASYQQARYPRRQIRILAELNCTTTEVILKIIENAPIKEAVKSQKIKRSHNLTEDEKEAIVNLYRGGESMDAIAMRLRRSMGTVHGFIMRNRDLCPKRHRTPLTAAEKAEIVRRREAGEKVCDIALAMGCTPSAISQNIKKEKQKRHESKNAQNV